MDYPVSLELDAPERVANWHPLVQWLLAFPHSVIAGALGYAAFAVAVVSWFAIVFTGRLSEGIANFQCIGLFLAVVAFATVFVLIAAFFAVLFTGRWPEGMRRFVLGSMRLGAQVSAYGCLLVDDYPPFSVSEPAPSPPSTQPST